MHHNFAISLKHFFRTRTYINKSYQMLYAQSNPKNGHRNFPKTGKSQEKQLQTFTLLYAQLQMIFEQKSNKR